MHPQGLLGVALILAVGYLLCPTRRAIERRVILAGVALQFAVAFLALSFPPVVAAIDAFAGVVTKVISFADEGTRFLFGSLADPGAGPWGFVFIIRVMPVIVFFASLMAVLYHLGVMQRVVGALAWLLRRTMGITGTEALCAATNVFVGQTEAPLTIKPYLPTMTRSQLMAVMTGGFATIAGSVLAAYVGILGGDDPESQRLFAKHLLTASVMSAPAGLVMAKLMLPETQSPPSESLRDLVTARPTTRNVIDAASEGATDGLKLALNVAAMLVAFVSLLALVNYPLAAISRWEPIAAWRAGMGIPELSFQNILGVVFTPLAWAMGVAWTDARAFGSMLGTQVILTEFVAYLDLGKHLQNGTLSPRSAQIATYALCGFANVASIAIQIGGLSAIAPERRAEFVKLAPRAMLAGALACWMTGAVAGVFIP